MENILAGVHEVATLVTDIPDEIRECPTATDDIKRLTAWRKTFENYSDFIALATGSFVTNYQKILMAHMDFTRLANAN